jgi:hypothetical protein
MSLYKPNNFSYRDTLPASHPEKVIKGETFDVEFEAIERALNSVEHILDPDGDGLDAIVEEAPLDGAVYARQNGGWTAIQLDGVPVTQEDIDRWNEAHGWGDHSKANYLDNKSVIFGGTY